MHPTCTCQVLFLDNTFRKLSKFAEGTLILAGDYNYISDLKFDRSYDPSAATIMKESSFMAFHRLLDTYDLIDPWRFVYPLTKDYMFYSAYNKVHTQIDMILISKGRESTILDTDIGVKTILDHSWTSCVLQLGDSDVYDKCWSMNKCLLLLDSVKEEIPKDIQTYFSESSTGDILETMIWDALKATLRGSLIAKAYFLKRSYQQKVQSIMQNIK